MQTELVAFMNLRIYIHIHIYVCIYTYIQQSLMKKDMDLKEKRQDINEKGHGFS